MLLLHIIRAFAIELPFSKIKIFVVILSKLVILMLIIYAYTPNKVNLLALVYELTMVNTFNLHSYFQHIQEFPFFISQTPLT